MSEGREEMVKTREKGCRTCDGTRTHHRRLWIEGKSCSHTLTQTARDAGEAGGRERVRRRGHQRGNQGISSRMREGKRAPQRLGLHVCLHRKLERVKERKRGKRCISCLRVCRSTGHDRSGRKGRSRERERECPRRDSLKKRASTYSSVA